MVGTKKDLMFGWEVLIIISGHNFDNGSFVKKQTPSYKEMLLFCVEI